MRESQFGELRGLWQTAISWATSEITIEIFINRKATKYKILSALNREQFNGTVPDEWRDWRRTVAGKTQPKESNLSLTHTQN